MKKSNWVIEKIEREANTLKRIIEDGQFDSIIDHCQKMEFSLHFQRHQPWWSNIPTIYPFILVTLHLLNFPVSYSPVITKKK